MPDQQEKTSTGVSTGGRYIVKYAWGDCDLATVEIKDKEAALPVIKAMVEFWSGFEGRLEDNGGDYILTWLRQLGLFILEHAREPGKEDEGWAILDGTVAGIEVSDVNPWEFWSDDVVVEGWEEAAHGA